MAERNTPSLDVMLSNDTSSVNRPVMNCPQTDNCLFYIRDRDLVPKEPAAPICDNYSMERFIIKQEDDAHKITYKLWDLAPAEEADETRTQVPTAPATLDQDENRGEDLSSQSGTLEDENIGEGDNGSGEETGSREGGVETPVS